jgi:hypothetical protein
MSNSKLTGKIFNLPEELLEVLGNIFTNYSGSKDINGYKRLEFLVTKKCCTYEQLKRIKHDLENIQDRNSVEYKLPGGDVLLQWVNDTLNLNRDLIKKSNNNKENMGLNGRTKDLTMKQADTSSRAILTTPEEIFNEELNRIKKLIIY